jgi:hypothetical protein
MVTHAGISRRERVETEWLRETPEMLKSSRGIGEAEVTLVSAEAAPEHGPDVVKVTIGDERYYVERAALRAFAGVRESVPGPDDWTPDA